MRAVSNTTRKREEGDVLIIEGAEWRIGVFESDERNKIGLPIKYPGDDFTMTVRLRWVPRSDVPEGWVLTRMVIPRQRVEVDYSTDVYMPAEFNETSEKWVIEFRNGGLFQNLESDHGGPLETACRFGSKQEAEAFMSANSWISLNGGMAKRCAL